MLPISFLLQTLQTSTCFSSTATRNQVSTAACVVIKTSRLGFSQCCVVVTCLHNLPYTQPLCSRSAALWLVFDCLGIVSGWLSHIRTEPYTYHFISGVYTGRVCHGLLNNALEHMFGKNMLTCGDELYNAAVVGMHNAISNALVPPTRAASNSVSSGLLGKLPTVIY
jgi:hypothetical protein